MMRPSLKVLLLLLSGLGHSAHGGEIINGEKVPEGEMLYMVSVQNARHRHFCGGFLISEDIVVTAAHCDEGKPTSVVIGSHDLSRTDDKTMRYTVKKCRHPFYVSTRYGADIMLLKLSKKVRLNKKVQPIKPPKSELHIKDGDTCQVAGWGISTPGGKSATNELQKVDVRYLSLDKCRKTWGHLPDTVMCAGGSTPDGKGFCQGDSGGPLVCKGKAVGIASFNADRNCTYPNYPNVYTNLSKYIDWINKMKKKWKCLI